MHSDLDKSDLQEYVGMYVYADMSFSKPAKILAVKKGVGYLHDGVQRDNALYAKTEGAKRYRWFASFGGNYRPMTRAEIKEYL